MSARQPQHHRDVETCVDEVIRRVGREIVLALPLGLGKPVQLANALYRRAVADPDLSLRIVTAISIGRPRPRSDLEQRFLGPFLERVFGDLPELDYVAAVRANALPPNVQVSEFFLNAGQYLNNANAQQHYISSNYTHVARDLAELGVNVCAQLVGKADVDGHTLYSLSSNADVTLDLLALLRQRRHTPVVAVAQVNTRMPFMFGDAMVAPSTFELVVDDPQYTFEPFGPPNMAVNNTDHMIGLLASTLIRDGGTLQIGIGSLGDAIVYATLLRHQDNRLYKELLAELGIQERFGEAISRHGGTLPFEQGLYGCSEMFVSGFKELYAGGVLKREVYPDPTIQRLVNDGRLEHAVTVETLEALLEERAIHSPLRRQDFALLQRHGILREELGFEGGEIVLADGSRIRGDLSGRANLERIARSCLGSGLKGGVVLHGGFFMGPRDFYDWLRGMDESERRRFAMASVRFVNQLYGQQELASLQRSHARLMNTTMMVTLFGAACSDGLDNGQVVSGVGGQYNFVAMAHELPDGRSILMLRSTREKGGKVTSNIVASYGNVTIPRHLRDIVITEYGIAELRGKTDMEVATALINVADSRFQDELLSQAKANGKVPRDYVIPQRFRDNTPERIASQLRPYRSQGHFPPFPFGTDFTDEELVLGKVLKALKGRLASPAGTLRAVTQAMDVGAIPAAASPYLQRLGLERPGSLKERMIQRVIVSELIARGHC